MGASRPLRRLIDRCAPLWAGEAEVFRAYWRWPKRTRESDRRWLAGQCFKEIWGSGVGDRSLGLFMGPVKQLESWFSQIDVDVDRHDVLEVAEFLRAEFSHYCAFADAYDALAESGEPKLTPQQLTGWPEDDDLAKLRYAHRDAHGDLGMRACRFTEGGYCTLYSEGMKLAGNGGRDELIASACATVYDDEFDHMLKGIAGLDGESPTETGWALLERLTVEQLELRIRMRNAQFASPLSETRIRAILAGDIAPLRFDYKRANLAAEPVLK
jgi:hypothetical protein